MTTRQQVIELNKRLRNHNSLKFATTQGSKKILQVKSKRGILMLRSESGWLKVYERFDAIYDDTLNERNFLC